MAVGAGECAPVWPARFVFGRGGPAQRVTTRRQRCRLQRQSPAQRSSPSLWQAPASLRLPWNAPPPQLQRQHCGTESQSETTVQGRHNHCTRAHAPVPGIGYPLLGPPHPPHAHVRTIASRWLQHDALKEHRHAKQKVDVGELPTGQQEENADAKAPSL